MSKSIICHLSACLCVREFNLMLMAESRKPSAGRWSIHPPPPVITVIKNRRRVREGNPLYNLPMKDRILCMTHVMKLPNETRWGWCGERQTVALMTINMRRFVWLNRSLHMKGVWVNGCCANTKAFNPSTMDFRSCTLTALQSALALLGNTEHKICWRGKHHLRWNVKCIIWSILLANNHHLRLWKSNITRVYREHMN